LSFKKVRMVPDRNATELDTQRAAELARRKDLRMAATLLAVAMLLFFSLWGLGDLYRRATEDQSWAEGRCADVDPEDRTGSADWYACIDRELEKNALEIAWPQMIGTAVGLGALVLARRIRVGSS
jgi:hypothetical protein